MKEKKKYIIVLVILAIYLVLIFVFNGKNIIRQNFDTSYIMVSPSTQWKYAKGTWGSVTNITDYSMEKFKIYVNNKPFGDYNVTYNDKFYLFDDNRNSVSYNGNIIAVKGSLPIDVIYFEEEVIEPINDEIKEALKEKKIKVKGDNIRARKVEIDMDGDQKKETIYIVSNVFYATEGENSFALLFTEKEGKNKYIYEEIKDYKKTLEMCTPFVEGIIDIDKDKKYEIIMGCEYFSNNGTCHNLYNNKTKDYQKVITNC